MGRVLIQLAPLAAPTFFPPGDFGPGATGKNNEETWVALETERWSAYRSAIVGTVSLVGAIFAETSKHPFVKRYATGFFGIGFTASAVLFYVAANQFTEIEGWPYEGLEVKTPRFEAFGGAGLGMLSTFFVRNALLNWKGGKRTGGIAGGIAAAAVGACFVYDAFLHPKPIRREPPRFNEAESVPV